MLGPRLLRIDLVAECKAYELSMGGPTGWGGEGSAWHRYELRAFQVEEASPLIGKSAAVAEGMMGGTRLFIERLRRAGKVEEMTTATILQPRDILAIAARRDVLVNVVEHTAMEVDDAELLSVPVEGVDVYLTNKHFNGKTVAELGHDPAAHGVFLRKITRGATATDIPILPRTQVYRGDILTISRPVGGNRRPRPRRSVSPTGPPDVTDVAFIGAGITLGALIGALSFNDRLGAAHPLDRRRRAHRRAGVRVVAVGASDLRPHSAAAVWFMNSVGLNVFIAVVGISAGPGFVAGVQQLGISLFLWGMFATTLPLVLGMFIGKYVFRFHPGILLGACAGARTTTAALGMVCETAKSQVPALGYTVTYAVGNTLLTIWGMVIVMLLS